VTIGALLGGIVEKGRLQAEAEEQLETLTALDGARAELLAVVTHELRTPLAVVRAYVDLLADAAADAAATIGAAGAAGAAGPPGPRGLSDPPRGCRARLRGCRARLGTYHAGRRGRGGRLRRPSGTRGRVARPGYRPGDASGSTGRLDPRFRARGGTGAGLARHPVDIARAVNDTIGEMTRLSARPPLRRTGTWEEMMGVGDEGRFRQVLEHLLENEVKTRRRAARSRGDVGASTARSGSTSRTTAWAFPSRIGSQSSRPTSGRQIAGEAPESVSTPPGDSWTRWADVSGWNQMGTVGAVLWWPYPRCATLTPVRRTRRRA